MHVKGFISHRCKEYDKLRWRSTFENYLKEHKIIPCYGCDLEIPANSTGEKETNIRQAIAASDMYIVFITNSWQETAHSNIGWPKKEYTIWKETHKNPHARARCFGFVHNADRAKISFVDNILSYEINQGGSGFSTSSAVLYKDDRNYEICVEDSSKVAIINARIDTIVETILKEKNEEDKRRKARNIRGKSAAIVLPVDSDGKVVYP